MRAMGGVLFFSKSGVVFSHTHSCAFFASVCIYVHFIVFLKQSVVLHSTNRLHYNAF